MNAVLNEQAERLKARARDRMKQEIGAIRTLRYTMADKLPDDDDPFDDELIEGVIGRAALAVLYGDSNSGKTFLAIDIGAAVCRGSPWLDRPVDSGLVLYLATEAPKSVCMRLRAYQRYHALRLPGFVIVESPIDLYDGDADTTAVIALVEHIEQLHGEKVKLIIGDTLARLSAGANENSGEDMGVVLKHIDIIKSATEATFLLVHHTGKDAARGMRGWSGLRAAIETEVEVTSDDASGLRTAEVTKQRDLPGKGLRLGFQLCPVPLGQNRWGTPRGSMVVLGAETMPKETQRRRPSEIAGAVAEFLSERGTGCMKGVIAKHFDGRYVSSAVYREIKKMVLDGRLHETAGIVAIAGKA